MTPFAQSACAAWASQGFKLTAPSAPFRVRVEGHCGCRLNMPTLPTKSLFDKDLSLRSPFPRNVSSFPQVPRDHSVPSGLNEERITSARTDYSQIQRPSPVKPKTAMSVFDLQLPQADAAQSVRTITTFHVQTFQFLIPN